MFYDSFHKNLYLIIPLKIVLILPLSVINQEKPFNSFLHFNYFFFCVFQSLPTS